MIPYEDLSGGQSQLIHVAIAFAISDVVDGENGCNLLILDEIFEHLSSENVDLISELIMMKSQNKSVHLITHLEKFNPVNSRIIRLGLVKGKTKAF
jgi:DNA repair exonuclease SbcCD ATPase subunit